MAPSTPKRRGANKASAEAVAGEKQLNQEILAKEAAPAKTKQKQKAVNRRAEIKERRLAAKAQAEKEAHMRPEDPDLNLTPGATPPLHVLNTRAKQAAYAERDVAREAANAGAKAAYDVFRGKSKGATSDSIARRFRTQNQAQVQLAKAAQSHAASQE